MRNFSNLGLAIGICRYKITHAVGDHQAESCSRCLNVICKITAMAKVLIPSGAKPRVQNACPFHTPPLIF